LQPAAAQPLVVVGPARPLELGSALLLRQPSLPGRPARLGRPPGSGGRSGRRRQQRGETAGRRLPVAQLGAMLGGGHGDGPVHQPVGEGVQCAFLERGAECVRAGQVIGKLDPAVRRVHRLPPRAGRPGETPGQFLRRYHRATDLDGSRHPSMIGRRPAGGPGRPRSPDRAGDAAQSGDSRRGRLGSRRSPLCRSVLSVHTGHAAGHRPGGRQSTSGPAPRELCRRVQAAHGPRQEAI